MSTLNPARRRRPDRIYDPSAAPDALTVLAHLVATVFLLVAAIAIAWLVLFPPQSAPAGTSGAHGGHSAALR